MVRCQLESLILLVLLPLASSAFGQDTTNQIHSDQPHSDQAHSDQRQIERKKIVIVAGLKSHGPEGNGIHDYAWSARFLKTALEHSNIRDSIHVVTHLNGWPSDKAAMEDAAAIMVLSDGRDGSKGREALHLATPERIEQVDSLAAAGTGIIAFHFSTFAPDELSDRVLDWYGGYFDWETDGERKWYSNIKTIQAMVTPAAPKHAILRGVEPFSLEDEFYFDIRFRPNDARWTPIWSVEALPHTKPNGTVVAWAVEREDGGRGFATTCGHFYDNWRDPNFRKTMLNALAWAAHVEIPSGGVESTFHSRDEIAAHLQLADVAVDTVSSGADETAYAEDPYWYKPGHPLRPAEPASISALPGFKVEQVYRVPEEQGSWTAITVDDRGRLICAAQHRPGLFRLTGTGVNETVTVERMGGRAAELGWSHGLLYAFDSLFVTVSEDNESLAGGVYRLGDEDGDDQYEKLDRLLELNSAGEHGAHNLVVGPDGHSLYLICGNGTQVPDDIVRHRPSRMEGNDHLVPPGFGDPRYTTAGFVIKFAPDGSEREIVCSGLRNSFDLAFNRAGDLFTFDSDMEWDLGAPWYRPTRICHLVSGGEFGWREDAAKWPDYYEDSVGPVVNIGPASPTGLVFGEGTRFPAAYQRALFACDWTFATIHAVHLEPHGSSYRARVEEFVGGNGLPVTDMVVGSDGNLYFLVGGRRLGSALYRIRYEGPESTAAVDSEPVDATTSKLQEVRRELENFHGQRSEKAIEAAWPQLGHEDRGIRFAARVAVESQPVTEWREAALLETDKTRQPIALLALARQETPERLGRLVRRVLAMDLDSLAPEQQLQTLRVLELAIARGGSHLEDAYASIAAALDPLFPSDDASLDRELVRLLCKTGSTESIDSILAHMKRDQGERPVLGSGYFVRNEKYGQAVADMVLSAPLVDRMHDAQMLLWLTRGWTEQQREEYFRSIADASVSSKGGYWYREFWERIREAALDSLPESERDRYAEIGAPTETAAGALPTPQGPGENWSLREILSAVTKDFRNRDHENGRKMYAAAKCITCHRFNGEGAAVGPDLSSIGQRFTLRDILDATLHPSKAVSDQYRVHMILSDDGQTIFGRIVARNSERVVIAPNQNRPTQTTELPVDRIELEKPVDVSTMPSELLNPLNRDEVLDLLAYLISGGDANHPIFE